MLLIREALNCAPGRRAAEGEHLRNARADALQRQQEQGGSRSRGGLLHFVSVAARGAPAGRCTERRRGERQGDTSQHP